MNNMIEQITWHLDDIKKDISPISYTQQARKIKHNIMSIEDILKKINEELNNAI